MKLLPFRNIDEKDIVNMYAFDSASAENGTFVSVSAANFGADPVEFVARSTANGGWASYDHSLSLYPEVPLRVTTAPAESLAASVLGVLLYDVKETDENGEKLIFNEQKRKQMKAVTSGQANPIAQRGILAFANGGFSGVPNVGDAVVLASAGVPSGVAVTGLSEDGTFPSISHVLGTVIGTGNRTSGYATDAYEGPYVVVNLK